MHCGFCCWLRYLSSISHADVHSGEPPVLVFLPAMLEKHIFRLGVVEAGVNSCHQGFSRLFGALAWLRPKAPVVRCTVLFSCLFHVHVQWWEWYFDPPTPYWSAISSSNITVFSVFFPWGVWGNESHRLPVIEGASFIICSGGVHVVFFFFFFFTLVPTNAFGLLKKKIRSASEKATQRNTFVLHPCNKIFFFFLLSACLILPTLYVASTITKQI